MIGAMPTATSAAMSSRNPLGDALGPKFHFRRPNHARNRNSACNSDLVERRLFQLSVVLPLLGGLSLFLTCTGLFEESVMKLVGVLVGCGGILAGVGITA